MNETCERCGRHVVGGHPDLLDKKTVFGIRFCSADRAVKVSARHGYYGCDSGCCGTEWSVECAGGRTYTAFDFSHDNEEARYVACELASKLGLDSSAVQVEDVENHC